MSKEIPIKDTKEYKWPSCQYCKDSTAEFADISVGSVGAPTNDWNSVIIRTDIGLKLFNDTVDSKKLITADIIDLSKIKKVSFRKKSQISKVDSKILSSMQLLGGTDLEVRTYAALISLGHANLSVLIKVMKEVKGMEKNSNVGSGNHAYNGTKDQDVKEVDKPGAYVLIESDKANQQMQVS